MINLRLNNNIFDKILRGETKIIRHGFSKNKKYSRLFGVIKEIELFNEARTESIIRAFKSIETIEENGKLIFKLEII